MTKLEIEQKKVIEKQEQEIKLMRKLAITDGFFKHYFSILKKFKTQADCFHHCNDLYFDFFGDYKYSTYDSFRQNLKRYYKK